MPYSVHADGIDAHFGGIDLDALDRPAVQRQRLMNGDLPAGADVFLAELQRERAEGIAFLRINLLPMDVALVQRRAVALLVTTSTPSCSASGVCMWNSMVTKPCSPDTGSMCC